MVKVDVISGFLGAGKTTLIKKLFESCFGKEKIVLIENEFGEIGIDGAFLKDSGVEIKEINSGCICCSLVGDFSASIKEVIEKFSPERIIIEPSGVGKLSDIVKAIKKVDAPLKLNIIATIVDGGKCKMYMKNFGEFFNDQVKEANTIVVSKTENLSEEKLKNAVTLLKMFNTHANIITTPVMSLDSAKLLEILEVNVSMVDKLVEDISKAHQHEEHEHHHHEHSAEHKCTCHDHDDDDDDDDDGNDGDEHEHNHEHGEHEHCTDPNCHCHDHEHEEHHHADEVFISWGRETVIAYTKAELDNILKTLTSDESLGIILRSKGIVKASDNGMWYYFDLVAGDYEIRLGSPDYTGRVCVIGSKIDIAKIEALFDKRG